MMKTENAPEMPLELIHSYTRAEALRDGQLVDLTEWARETGFRYPVACTASVWQGFIEWTESDSKRQTYQDTRGRAHDILWMLYLAARKAKGSRLTFSFYCIRRDGKSRRPKLVTLESVCGPGDDLRPVLTIQRKGED